MKITLEYYLTNPLSVIINQDGSIGKITIITCFNRMTAPMNYLLKWPNMELAIAYPTISK